MLLDCKNPLVKDLVTSDATVCKKPYVQLEAKNSAPTSAPVRAHDPACTLIPKPEPSHRCVRPGGYIKLTGSNTDVYLHPTRLMFRIQPAGTDPDNANVPSLTFSITNYYAARDTGMLTKDKQLIFAPPASKESLDLPVTTNNKLIWFFGFVNAFQL